MQWDESAVARWLEPLAARPGEIADVFAERMREVTLEWRDGEVHEVRVRREEGVAARWRHGHEERFAYAAGSGESSVREAVRALRAAAGREARPLRVAIPRGIRGRLRRRPRRRQCDRRDGRGGCRRAASWADASAGPGS